MVRQISMRNIIEVTVQIPDPEYCSSEHKTCCFLIEGYDGWCAIYRNKSGVGRRLRKKQNKWKRCKACMDDSVSRSNIKQICPGRVDSVDLDYFTATITDRTDSSQPDESIEIPLSELSPTDRAYVKPGALFVWRIVYKDVGSSRQTISEFILMRWNK